MRKCAIPKWYRKYVNRVAKDILDPEITGERLYLDICNLDIMLVDVCYSDVANYRIWKFRHDVMIWLHAELGVLWKFDFHNRHGAVRLWFKYMLMGTTPTTFCTTFCVERAQIFRGIDDPWGITRVPVPVCEYAARRICDQIMQFNHSNSFIIGFMKNDPIDM